MMEFEGQGKHWPTVEEVLAKESWGEDDITVLVYNKESLPHDALVKLGLADAEPVVEATEVVEKKAAVKKAK